MPLEISPPPPEDVRQALERELERELMTEPAPGEWWLAGIRESVAFDDDS